jgi:catechol 2,3-dioxygenase
MAMNTWNSRGAGQRRLALGLGEVAIHVPTADDLGALAERMRHYGVHTRDDGRSLSFDDPWANTVRVEAAPEAPRS